VTTVNTYFFSRNVTLVAARRLNCVGPHAEYTIYASRWEALAQNASEYGEQSSRYLGSKFIRIGIVVLQRHLHLEVGVMHLDEKRVDIEVVHIFDHRKSLNTKSLDDFDRLLSRHTLVGLLSKYESKAKHTREREREREREGMRHT